ncbi:RES family NAD+ phosphorylase [Tropicimonas aquimaris]|uniref:RES family NAD+ phosphorylase n=1 Tax=Tropicimonas aquimaris TaxID=914152 RepID=A0ABW3IWT5_9RHOB
MSAFVLPASARIGRHHKIAAGWVLFRNHHKDYPGATFNPCAGDPTRFAPLHTATGDCIPTLYAASTFDAAAYETVFREPPGRYASYLRQKLQNRGVSRIAPTADLHLVPFFTPELGSLGLSEDSVFRPAETVYAFCRRLAELAWRDNPTAQGVVWSSVRDSQAHAMVLFGDRLTPSDFDVLETRMVATDPTLLDEFSDTAARSGTIISK